MCATFLAAVFVALVSTSGLQKQHKNVKCNLDYENLTMKRSFDICTIINTFKPCTGDCDKYYYDHESHSCLKSPQGQAPSTENQFQCLADCQYICVEGNEIRFAKAPQDGTGVRELPRYFYDWRDEECYIIFVPECINLSNVYISPMECISTCSHAIVDQKCYADKPSNTEAGTFDVCTTVPKWDGCYDCDATYYYDQASRSCQAKSGATATLNSENHFNSSDICRATCVDGTLNRTRMVPLQESCDGVSIKYYYDWEADKCERFYKPECLHFYNSFDSEQECEGACRAPTSRRPSDPVSQSQSLKFKPSAHSGSTLSAANDDVTEYCVCPEGYENEYKQPERFVLYE